MIIVMALKNVLLFLILWKDIFLFGFDSNTSKQTKLMIELTISVLVLISRIILRMQKDHRSIVSGVSPEMIGGIWWVIDQTTRPKRWKKTKKYKPCGPVLLGPHWASYFCSTQTASTITTKIRTTRWQSLTHAYESQWLILTENQLNLYTMDVWKLGHIVANDVSIVLEQVR